MVGDGYYIYKYVTKNDRIVYIGKTINLDQRIKQHSSYKDIDKKFQQYPDANIYIHKCASKHEMDALEILLIEKYKPDLNVTAKTDNALTVSIGDDLEWIDYKTFKKQEKKQVLTQRNTKKHKENGIIIASDKTWDKFLDKVIEWHTLHYFIQWLMEQDENDSRTTIHFNLAQKEESEKWTYFYNKETNVWNPIECTDVNIINVSGEYNKANFHAVTTLIRKNDDIWIDLLYPISLLRKGICVFVKNANDIRDEIKKYNNIKEEYLVRNMDKMDLFYKVRNEEMFYSIYPEISKEVCNKIGSEYFTGENIADEHMSPEIDFDSPNMKMKIGFGNDGDYYMVGGAYWNIFNYGTRWKL